MTNLLSTVQKKNNNKLTNIYTSQTDKDIQIGKSDCNASVLVKTLEKLNVDSIFGYPGAAVLSIYNELEKTNSIKHFLVRHEQAAVHAAEGYASVSGKTGVVLVTSGPGFTNTITGIANACADSTPLVILAGDVAVPNKKGKVFQDVNIVSMTKTCTKKCFVLTKNNDIADILKSAFETANSGIKGPVVVVLPRKLLESTYKSKPSAKKPISKNKTRSFKREINVISKLINNSNSPLILLGGGAVHAQNEIRQFVSKTQIPVVSTLMGIGTFPSENDLYLGMIGLNGSNSANNALKKCDLLISLGTSFSDRSTCKNPKFAQNTQIISINLKKISKNFKYNIVGDVREFLNALLSSNTKLVSKCISIPKTGKQKQSLCPKNGNSLSSAYVLKTISEFTKELNPIVVTDVGQHQMLTAQFFNFNKARTFITSGGLGTMGFGLPASIGAYIANPNNLVLNITGDGSFQMNLQELATCREHNIPVKIIIMNNGYLGMVRQIQEKIYKKIYQVKMINPDFTKIAEAYDLCAIRVNTPNELTSALEKAINHSGTAIVDIAINSFENI